MSRPGFVDTHVHFWDRTHPTLRYDWLEPGAEDPELGDYGAIKSLRYTPKDFAAETRFARVEKVVHMQAAIGSLDPVEESRWLAEFAESTGVPAAMVAAAELDRPDAADLLARQAEVPGVVGVRDLRYDGYLEDEAWGKGFALLEQYGLVCCDDPLLEHMPAAAALVERHCGVTYCVDHAGFPHERGDDYFRGWAAAMRRLAAVENTVVKISGLGQADHHWTVASLRPWVLECIELWGPDRAFFGTNWPVDRLYSSYGDVVDAYDQITAEFSVAEREALFCGTASRVFKLGRTT